MADMESGSEGSMTEDEEREFLLALEAMEKRLLLSISRIADTIDGMGSDIADMVDGMRSDIADMRMNIAWMGDSFERMDRADRVATIAARRMGSVRFVESVDWLGFPEVRAVVMLPTSLSPYQFVARSKGQRVPSPVAQ